MSSPETSGQVVGPDLSCLLDCFQETTLRTGSDGSCIASLIRDVIEKKTCDKLDDMGESILFFLKIYDLFTTPKNIIMDFYKQVEHSLLL